MGGTTATQTFIPIDRRWEHWPASVLALVITVCAVGMHMDEQRQAASARWSHEPLRPFVSATVVNVWDGDGRLRMRYETVTDPRQLRQLAAFFDASGRSAPVRPVGWWRPLLTAQLHRADGSCVSVYADRRLWGSRAGEFPLCGDLSGFVAEMMADRTPAQSADQVEQVDAIAERFARAMAAGRTRSVGPMLAGGWQSSSASAVSTDEPSKVPLGWSSSAVAAAMDEFRSVQLPAGREPAVMVDETIVRGLVAGVRLTVVGAHSRHFYVMLQRGRGGWRVLHADHTQSWVALEYRKRPAKHIFRLTRW